MDVRRIGLVLALCLLTPNLASAHHLDADDTGWGNGSPAEPNTHADLSQGWMFTDRAHFQTTGRYDRAILDARLVMLPGSDVPGLPEYGRLVEIVAAAGAWRDCDRDGHIGLAGVFNPYRIELLDSQELCPFGERHIDNEFVREYLPFDPDWATLWADILFGPTPTDDIVTFSPTGVTPSKTHADHVLHYVESDTSNSGLCLVNPACTGWTSGPFVLVDPTVRAGESGPDLASMRAVRLDVYAWPGEADRFTLDFAAQAIGSYGADFCQRADWDCSHWQSDSPAIGDAYLMRDVELLWIPQARTLVEPDGDRDGIGDIYASAYGIAGMLGDFDTDGAGVLHEYRWQTHPFEADTDDDNWTDGAEIDYWDATDDSTLETTNMAGHAMTDSGANVDLDDDTLPNQLDPDADGDRIIDGDEIRIYKTYPEYADSDCEAASTACTPVSQTRYGQARTGRPGSGDGLNDRAEFDYWENALGTGGAHSDCDGDGIPNILDGDSDNDGLTDGEEVHPTIDEVDDDQEGGAMQQPVFASDPCDGDSDDDGLNDGDEKTYLTDPHDPDTDDDGLTDAWEVEYGFEPHGLDESTLDFDQDGLTNLEEQTAHSHPRLADTDGDGLDDKQEVLIGTLPYDQDSDDDGMPDGWEVDHDLDPLADDGRLDPDNDNVTNYAEYSYQPYGEPAGVATLDPQDADTDDDNMTDGDEIAAGTDPRYPGGETVEDVDGDGLTYLQEMALHTYPGTPDSDRDGLCDGGGGPACSLGATTSYGGGERDAQSNPLSFDSDGDGLGDGAEAALAGMAFRDDDGDGDSFARDSDSDNDGLDDLADLQAGGSPFDADSDDDGADDWLEASEGTSLTDPDSDGDGLLDGVELTQTYTDPLDADSDDDGLDDATETALETNPFLCDTDRDSMDDAWEVANGLNPLFDDSGLDPDQDSPLGSFTNLEEYLHDTDPMAADTDQDGVNDAWEVWFGLDPRDGGDVLRDGDQDGLTSLDEFLLGTDPGDDDSDDDGLLDGEETGPPTTGAIVTRLLSDPTLRDSDSDGLDDARELAYWNGAGGPYDPTTGVSRLRMADSDGDGLDDGQEVLAFLTDPANRDSDNDGWDDHSEIMVRATDPHRADATATTPRTSGRTIDSDGDGLDDDTERAAWGAQADDDIDGDGLPNLLDYDSDNDGLSDGFEFAIAGLDRARTRITSPRLADTDEDGLLDSEEGYEDATIVDDLATRAPAGATSAAGTTTATGPTDRRPTLAPAPFAATPQRGAYGLGVITHGPHQAPRGEGSSSKQGDPSRSDSDNDRWLDGYEYHITGTDLNDADTDDDTIPDARDGRLDHDNDGLPDALDDDSDDDGISDASERNPMTGRGYAGRTDPNDADSDDDGLCDGWETKTSPTDPDSDDDGLSDGLESRARHGCFTPHRTDWTQSKTLTPTLNTFQPYLGNQATPNNQDDLQGESRETAPYAQTTATSYGPLAMDTDGDGMIDGLEDWNANGKLDPGETDPRKWDTDGDGLSDAWEQRVWGSMTRQDFEQHAGRENINPEYRATYWPGHPSKTNPQSRDTDGDGVADSNDLSPKTPEAPTLNLAFDTVTVYDPIDPKPDEYTPELVFDIDLTLQDLVVQITTTEINAWTIKEAGDTFNLSAESLSEVSRSNPTLFDVAPANLGALSVQLPSDATSFAGTLSGTPAWVVQLRVDLWEQDGWLPKDHLDLDGRIEGRAMTSDIDIMRLVNNGAEIRVADGTHEVDRNADADDDDAGLVVRAWSSIDVEDLKAVIAIADHDTPDQGAPAYGGLM